LAIFAFFTECTQMDERLVLLSDVQPAPVRWLWPGRVPLGAITLLEADPGMSKSLLTYALVARLTTGRPMPNCEGGMAPAGAVLLQAEDHLGTVKGNLEAAGADTKRVVVCDKKFCADRPLLLPADLPCLEAAVASVRARLVVVDPLTAFLGGSVNVDQDVRRALAPVAAFAERTGVAVLLVRHLTKAGGSNPLYRGAGSIAIIASARSALLVANDPGSDDPHRHIVAVSKASLCGALSLVYRTVPKDAGVVIEWLGESTHTARDLADSGRAEHSALAEAAYVLYSILAEGPVWAREVIRLAGKAGIAKRSLDRAKLLLGVKSRKRGSGRGSRWVWELPDDEARLRPFKDRDVEDLMDRLIYGDDDPPLPGDEWKRGYRGEGDGGQDEEDDDGGQRQPQA
jgi:hypothetical protein